MLLTNIRSEREGNWPMHLHSTEAMLPLLFITNHTNYSRWMPVYLLNMTELPEEITDAFTDGEFTVRQTEGRFKGVWWSEMGTEKTIIKDAKSESGIIRLTRKKPALVRWTLTRHLLGAYTMHYHETAVWHQSTG